MRARCDKISPEKVLKESSAQAARCEIYIDLVQVSVVSYATNGVLLFQEAPQKELDVNLAKIGYAMFRPDAADAVRPLAFKNYIGKGQRHPLFSTGQQQDAAEFLAHVLSVVSRAQARAQALFFLSVRCLSTLHSQF